MGAATIYLGRLSLTVERCWNEGPSYKSIYPLQCVRAISRSSTGPPAALTPETPANTATHMHGAANRLNPPEPMMFPRFVPALDQTDAHEVAINDRHTGNAPSQTSAESAKLFCHFRLYRALFKKVCVKAPTTDAELLATIASCRRRLAERSDRMVECGV